MKKIITLAQSLMQEIERYDKELIEIERVADYRYEENEQLKEQNKRAKVLLKATLDLLQKQKDSRDVLNLLETTTFYDEADCDGECLLNDIEDFLTQDV